MSKYLVSLIWYMVVVKATAGVHPKSKICKIENMIYLIVAIIFIAGLYSVMIVGITGGPNNGEHPLLITLIHLTIFYFTAGSWPEHLFNLYFWILIFCLAASIVGFGNSECAMRKGRFLLARVILSIGNAGFIFIYLSVHKVI